MSGVAYLHELGIVHGDLKGVLFNIRVDFLYSFTDHLSRQMFSLMTTVSPASLTLVS